MLESLIVKWLPFAITLIGAVVALYFANWLLLKKNVRREQAFSRQLLMVALVFCAILACIIVLPLSDEVTIQVLSLFGIALSGLLAFSSTTIFTNLVAGIMMRFTRPFRTGDFIQVKEYFGRITERGLLDCEIQTEDSDLVAIPNIVLVQHAVKTVRKSGTIVSAELSLGYELHHKTIEKILTKAAENAGLQEAFVHVTQLGDFSVTYKVSGLLENVKSLLTTRSNLYCQVLDALHAADIEIVSPNFINQRVLNQDFEAIAKPTRFGSRAIKSKPETSAEDIAFDKAEKAEQKENLGEQLGQRIEVLKQQLDDADSEQKDLIKSQIDRLKTQLEELDNLQSV